MIIMFIAVKRPVESSIEAGDVNFRFLNRIKLLGCRIGDFHLFKLGLVKLTFYLHLLKAGILFGE